MTNLEIAIVAMLFLCNFFLLVICRCLWDIYQVGKDVADDIDLIRSAAEGIERNVGVIAAPMNSRKQKRFQRRLRRAWPHIIGTLETYFDKPRRTIVDPHAVPDVASAGNVFVKKPTTIEHNHGPIN